MTENKEIIEKLVELVEIYLKNSQMNEVSTEWQEGHIDFEDALAIVVHDGLYDLNFTEEQTNEFLALYKALNQEQVEISEAKLDKEEEKGDNTMGAYLKEEFKDGGVFIYRGGKVSAEDAPKIKVVHFAKDFKGSEIPGFAFDGCVNLEEIYIPSTITKIGINAFQGCEKIKIFMSKRSIKVYPNNADFIKSRLTYIEESKIPLVELELKEVVLEPVEEAKKPVMESKKQIKEGIRLVYSPKQKTVKEEVKLSFDGEPLPLDIKESNTHHKLRLFKHK